MIKVKELIRHALLVRRLKNKPILRQIQEIFSLSLGENRLGMSEYYELGVFDDEHFPRDKKRDCIGWRASIKIDGRLNHNRWRATANDKVLNYALLQHYGYPTPETLATFSKQKRKIGSELLLHTDLELRHFLTQTMTFPIFIKPIHGSYGRGTFLLDSYAAETQSFIDSRGNTVLLDELLQACLHPKYAGMLFQKVLQPHENLQKLTGTTTSTVRIIVATCNGEPKVHLAFWKVARAHNITDNFHMGATGNLLASIDKDSGTVTRVITGLWPSGHDVNQHPDTSEPLLGTVLPDWQKAVQMCTEAALQFPGLRLQHWDVAFCRGGPVLMELNTEADLGVPQFLEQKPFVDDVIRSML
jgi:hypothetical protein